MGQSCCVAARSKSLPNRNNHEASTFRNVRQSPTWSFRWDNRTHIEDIMENRTYFSHHNNGNATSEVKSVVDVGTSGLSIGESPPKPLQPSQRKSFKSGGLENSKLNVADQSASSNSSLKGNLLPHKSSAFPYASTTKPLLTVKVEDPSSSNAILIASDPNSSRKPTHSPGFQLHRQISNSRIPSSEGSHGGSSDGWSMRTFSELVASSQRERWSLDEENFAIAGKILGATLDWEGENLSPNLRTCGICTKLLDDVPPSSRYYAYPVAAVLFCGHVFHAECLENMTPEAEMHDPPCHVCARDRRREGKTKKRSLIHRAAPTTDSEADSGSSHSKRSGKAPIMGASSSMKSSFGRPFLRRHLSVGPRPVRSASENETRKRWFWPRYTRE